MRTIFIGDIHGCAAELAELLEDLDFDDREDRLLLAGDAFSRGPDPLAVWRLIKKTGAAMVMGNHDERLLGHLKLQRKGKSPDFRNPDQQRTLEALAKVAKPLYTWLKALPNYIEEEGFVLVHAGLNPQKGLAGTTAQEYRTIRTWPPVKGIEGSRWHDHWPPSEQLIIFGHDAPGGLVQKRRANGTLYALGLDSGCVYGRALTAYIMEEDRLVQVQSRQKDRWGKK